MHVQAYCYLLVQQQVSIHLIWLNVTHLHHVILCLQQVMYEISGTMGQTHITAEGPTSPASHYVVVVHVVI